ncbi:MAG TPA: hypothetical protein VFV99_07805 [Kofleriaceae bacterium]|nr:hypothetical protein [Kofleriaceae bacterium]
MSGAVCPSCGVAVVPGYVRCPKCHKALPRARGSHLEGGTAVASATGKGPLITAIAIGVVAIGAIAYLGLRKNEKPAAQPAATVETPAVPAQAEVETPAQPTEQPAQPTGPTALDVAAGLERNLKKQRLWSTVSIIGDHVDVRSGSCEDPGMKPALDEVAPSFKAAGLTSLRCLEQSGRVVTARDL